MKKVLGFAMVLVVVLLLGIIWSDGWFVGNIHNAYECKKLTYEIINKLKLTSRPIQIDRNWVTLDLTIPYKKGKIWENNFTALSVDESEERDGGVYVMVMGTYDYSSNSMNPRSLGIFVSKRGNTELQEIPFDYTAEHFVDKNLDGLPDEFKEKTKPKRVYFTSAGDFLSKLVTTIDMEEREYSPGMMKKIDKIHLKRLRFIHDHLYKESSIKT